jgi:hypothetical protein
MRKPILVFSIDILFVTLAIWAKISGGNMFLRIPGAANVSKADCHVGKMGIKSGACQILHTVVMGEKKPWLSYRKFCLVGPAITDRANDVKTGCAGCHIFLI